MQQYFVIFLNEIFYAVIQFFFSVIESTLCVSMADFYTLPYFSTCVDYKVVKVHDDIRAEMNDSARCLLFWVS